MRATPIQRHCHLRNVCRVGIEFKNWSGARDLNPGPHGPEIYAVSSTGASFVGFEFISTTQPPVSSSFQPQDSAGLHMNCYMERDFEEGHAGLPGPMSLRGRRGAFESDVIKFWRPGPSGTTESANTQLGPVRHPSI